MSRKMMEGITRAERAGVASGVIPAAMALFGLIAVLLVPAATTGEAGRPSPDHAVALTQVRDSVFDHEQHRSVECATCHTAIQAPSGAYSDWCVSCHHSPRARRDCVACHEAEGLEGIAESLPMTLPGGPETRELTFGHEAHAASTVCGDCHGDPPTRDQAKGGCADCHERHHEAEAITCLGCHAAPPEWAHESVVVHQGCAGGICHTRFPIEDPTLMKRPVCEACHEDFRTRDSLPALPVWDPPQRVIAPDTAMSPDSAAKPDTTRFGAPALALPRLRSGL